MIKGVDSSRVLGASPASPTLGGRAVPISLVAVGLKQGRGRMQGLAQGLAHNKLLREWSQGQPPLDQGLRLDECTKTSPDPGDGYTCNR